MTTPERMSHAMLLAILMDHGGSLTLPAKAFETDKLGGPDGSFHAVQMETLGDGSIRISVVSRPAGDDGGIEIR
ncbi:pRL2-19 [Streptomyces sp. S1]|uniref:pRL2-19 n=1 Tax=Streptomyces sp. S1 TaxID=718288 RepID=UPI000EF8388C|nr:pRL2-19 [Streptomyces sp. S1]